VDDEKTYLICGLGAVGILLGVRLLKAGYDVTFLTKTSAPLDTISLDDTRERCLITVQGIRSISRENLSGKYDVVFPCSKTPDLDGMCAVLPAVMSASSIVIPIQNGLNIDRRVGNRLQIGTVLSGTIYTNVTRVNSTTAKLVGEPHVVLGFREERNKKHAVRLADALSKAGVPSGISGDVDIEQWKKFISLTAFSLITASSRKTIGEIMSDVSLRHNLSQAVDEGCRVAKACNVLIDTDHISEEIRARFHRQARDNSEARSSLSFDVEAGRRGELDDLSGYLIKLAQNHQVSVPTHTRFYEHIIEGITMRQKSGGRITDRIQNEGGNISADRAPALL